MSTYKTGNPLGSAAVKDLFDNAENLDFALNSLTALIWTDRLGKTRRSFFGMESAFVTQLTSQESRFNTFIQSSGYQIVGDYTAGPLTLTEYNQLIRYNNELYKLTAATDIPFTTAGNTDETWTSTDAAHFVSVGDAALRQNLGSSEGLGLVGQCPNLAALRAISFSFVGQQIFLSEHTSGQGAGGGIFYCHSLISDSTYVDDNGCQIINDYGQVIRRKDFSKISLDMFGGRGGVLIDPMIDNGYQATRTFCKPTLWIPELPPEQGYFLNGGLIYSVGQTETGGRLPFFIRGEGDGADYAGPPIFHFGNNIGITIQREPDGTTPRFWVCGGVIGVQFNGTKEDGSGVNEGDIATPVRISDGWNFKAHYFVSGYTKNNCALSVYNRKKWTEGTDIKLNCRQSLTGVRFHRNKEAGSTATDSFFRTKADVDFNAGISGTGVTGIVLGDGTEAGKCFMYGHDINLTLWMSNGSWHNGILCSDYSHFAEDGQVRLIADGYGLSRTVLPASEVVHLIRLGGQNARFRSRVINDSGQGGDWTLDYLNLVFQSCMYTKSQVFYPSDYDAVSPLRPRGMQLYFNGKFTVDERHSGKIYTLDGLIPGMRLLVEVASWKGNDHHSNSLQSWSIEVRGTDEPCIVTPIAGSVNLSTTKAAALTSTGGATDSFVKDVSLTNPRLWVGGDEPYALTVKNANDNNNINYAANSGRKIRFVLPPFSGATTASPYYVSIKVD